MKQCPSCSRMVEEFIDRCPTCGSFIYPPKKRSKKPEIAGGLMIVSALLAISFAIISLTGVGELMEVSQVEISEELDMDLLETVLQICFGLIIFLGVVQIVGGYLAYNRRYWVFAIICAIIGIFLIGFFFISTVVSIIALVLLFMSKDEFD